MCDRMPHKPKPVVRSQLLWNRGELRVEILGDWSFRHYLRVVKESAESER